MSEPVELTEAEKADLIDAFQDGYLMSTDPLTSDLTQLGIVVTRIKAAARREALLEAIERIESLAGDYTNGGQTLSWQGARHCVETALTEPNTRDEGRDHVAEADEIRKQVRG